MLSGAFGPRDLLCDAPIRADHGSVRCFLDGDDVADGTAAGLAAGFAHQREQVLDDLRGRFVVVLWDAAQREGLIAVDHLASRPLFYRRSGDNLDFAGELRDLLDALPATPAPSSNAMARWLSSGMLHPDETLYDSVDRLPGGHFLRLCEGGSQRHTYWQPQYPTPLYVGRAEAVELVRAEIVRAIEERSMGRPGVMLSGGLDSTSIAAVARRSIGGRGKLAAYSATFPDHPETDESAIIASTSAALGLSWKPTPTRAEGVMAATLDHVREWRVPPSAPTLFFQMPVIESAAHDGVTVLFDGQGGDELFGASAYLLADMLRRGRLRPLRRLARTLPGFGPTPERRLVAAAIRTFGVAGAAPLWANRLRNSVRRPPAATVLRPEFARAADTDGRRWEWKRLDGPRWWAALADQLTAGRERILAHEFLRRKFAAANIIGAHPYLDDLGLIELMLRIPPELSFDPVFDRPLLREAACGLIPESVRLRVGKSRFDAPVIAALSGPDLDVVRGLLAVSDARVREYVSTEALGRLTETAADKRDATWARTVFRLASTEQWLLLLDGAKTRQ